MKVKMPRPLGDPEIFYNKRFEGVRFSRDDLEGLLKDTEERLDEVCEEVKDRDIVILYKLVIYEIKNTKHLVETPSRGFLETRDLDYFMFMDGGFDLSAELGRKLSLPGFQKGYKEGFKSALDKFRDCAFDIELSVFGYTHRK